jgi:hypothetical protein
MDCEVNALMGATDEELWEREGLYSSVDELCRSKCSGCINKEHINSPR